MNEEHCLGLGPVLKSACRTRSRTGRPFNELGLALGQLVLECEHLIGDRFTALLVDMETSAVSNSPRAVKC